MFDKTLKTIILLSPLVYMRGMTIDRFDLVLFPLFAIALFVSSLYTEVNRRINFKPLSILAAIMAINLFISGFNPIVLSAFINFSFGMMIVVLIAKHVNHPEKCFEIAVLAGVLNLGIALGQYYGFDPIITATAEPGGVFGSSPRLCMYLMIILPFAWSVSPIFFILFAISCFLMNEKLILLFAPMVLLGMNAKKLICSNKPFFVLIIVCFSIIAGIVFHQKILNSFIIRLPIWIPTIEQVFQRPLKGFGVGIFPHVSGQFIKSYWHADTAFSSGLQFLFGIGFVWGIGVVIYVTKYIMETCFHFQEDAEPWAVGSLGLLCLVEYPLEVPKLWIIICVVIAFSLIKRTESMEVD